MLHRTLSLALPTALILGCTSGPPREVTPWTKQFGVSGDQTLNGLAVGADGVVALTGAFTQEINFGGGRLVSAGSNDIFVTLLDDSAGPLWSGRTGSQGSQSGQAI